MDELQARHRKELRDLQALVTQKKKSASKKTRKAVNGECSTLEQNLRSRHVKELAESNGEATPNGHTPAGLDDAGNGDDDDLLDSIAGLSLPPSDPSEDAPDLTQEPPASDAPSSRRPNRQKARMARRAAEQDEITAQAAREAASIPDMRTRERDRMTELITARGLTEKEVAANGHCLYLSFADQLNQLRLPGDASLESTESSTQSSATYPAVRAAAADYISAHHDDYAPFVEGSFDEYVHRIRSTGEWGGHLELSALSKSYQININVIQADGDVVKVESGSAPVRGDAWLAYYRHGFGLGEHYNSLRGVKKADS